MYHFLSQSMVVFGLSGYESDEECFDLISTHDDLYPQFYGKLRENIMNSNKYELTDDSRNFEVIESFLT